MTNKATKYGLMTIAAVLLVVMAFAGAASAEITGAGTQLDPYTISSAEDLNTMAGWINAGQNATANYTLAENIEITGTAYKTIGIQNTYPFKGHFDGKNKTISGQIVNDSVSQGLGLFGFINNATIENLVLKDLLVTGASGTTDVGALVGRMESDGSSDVTIGSDKSAYHSRISNVKLNNVSVSSGSHNVGGLVGYAECASLWIENVVTGTDCSVSSLSYRVGGLVGCAGSASLEIQGCKVAGTTLSDHYIVGGLVGYTYSGSLEIQDCEVTGSALSGVNTGTGGLVGIADVTNVDIQGCKVAGTTLSGSDSVGGLVGSANPAKYLNISRCEVSETTVTRGSDAGGLIGKTNGASNLTYCTVTNCTFSGSDYVGGMLGDATNDANVTITNCAAIDCTITGNSVVGGQIGYALSAPVSLENCKVKQCDITVAGTNNAGGLVGRADNTHVKTVNCKVTYCNISSVAVGASGLVARPLNATIDASDCEVNHCNISAVSSDVGGLFGQTTSGAVINASGCNVVHCTIKTDTRYIGGLIARVSGATFNASNCNVKYCNIYDDPGADNGCVGGLVGLADNGVVTIARCNVTNSAITASKSGSGGLVGYSHMPITLTACKVAECTISAGNQDVGGIIGAVDGTGSFIANHCEVVDCENIIGDYKIGGIAGYIADNIQVLINHSTVKDSSISSRGTLTSTNTIGGLLGVVNKNESSCLNNNTLENVEINVTAGDAQYAYLFDVSEYPVNSTNGIAKLAQVNLANDNKIINSYVLNSSGDENTKLDGFANLTTEFAITISNPSITVIDDDAFKDSNLTGISGIELINRIGSNAFTGSGITSAIALPNTATEGYSAVWILQNDTRDEITSLAPSKFMYAVEKKETQEVTLDARGGIVSGKLIVNYSEIPGTAPIAEKAGYNFSGWYGETALTNMVFNDTGVINKSVSGWTDADSKWIHEGPSTLYANLSAVEYNNSVVDNNVTFPSVLLVVSIKFNPNSDVTKVAFKYEAPQGNPQKEGVTVDTIGDPFTLTPTGSLNGTKAIVNFNITSAQMGCYNTANIRLAHYVGSAWTFVKPTYNGLIAENHTFSAEIDSMSPFAVVSYVENPPAYTPSSSSKQTGSTVILQEGQVAPTAYATAAPTVAPTVKPTEKPATPTVIATEKPTTQATQSSPAPFVGLLAGLGAAAVLLRLRK